MAKQDSTSSRQLPADAPAHLAVSSADTEQLATPLGPARSAPDNVASAAHGTGGAPTSRSRSRSKKRAGPSAGRDVLDGYMDQLASLPLLTAEDELRLGSELLQHELTTWRTVLACPRAVEHVLHLAEAGTGGLEAPIVAQLRALDAAYRRAANRTFKKDLADGPQKKAAIATLAAALRQADMDKLVLDGLMEIIRPEVWSRRVLTEKLAFRLTHADLTAIERSRGAALRVRDQFVRANLRLVVSVARKFHYGKLPFIDLVQEGNVGLMKAVHRFDHTRGFRFSTYGHWWIRQCIERAIANKSTQVRLPIHVVDIRRTYQRTKVALKKATGALPTPQEIAAAMGMPLDKVEQATGGLQQQPISLDQHIAEGDSRSLLDFVGDEDATPQDEAFIRENTHAKVRELLHLLSPVEKDIIRRRYGLGADADQTLDEIGKIYNLSRERVRQLQAASLQKMRRMCQRRRIE